MNTAEDKNMMGVTSCEQFIAQMIQKSFEFAIAIFYNIWP